MLFEKVQNSVGDSVKTIGGVLGGVASSIGGAITSRASGEIMQAGADLERKFIDKEAEARKKTDAGKGAMSGIALLGVMVLGFFVLRKVKVRV